MRRNSACDGAEFQCEKDPQCPYSERTDIGHRRRVRVLAVIRRGQFAARKISPRPTVPAGYGTS
jgi:hypothetical protein